MNIRTIVTDMDDTLLTSDLSISPYTLEQLNRAAARGVGVALASGRSPASIRQLVRALHVNRPVIACNGAVIVDHKTGEVLDERLFTVAQARACARFAKAHGCYVHVYYGDCFYYSHPCDWQRLYARASRLRGVCVGDVAAFITKPTSKLILIAPGETVERLYPLAQRELGDAASVTVSKPEYLEFLAPGSSKGAALERLSRLRGDIDRATTVAFGDSLNDLTMLQWAGMGVAMGNARAEIRAIADVVCESNDEDGIGRTLARLMPTEEVLP